MKMSNDFLKNRRKKIIVPCDIETFRNLNISSLLISGAYKDTAYIITLEREDLQKAFNRYFPSYSYIYYYDGELLEQNLKAEIIDLWNTYCEQNQHNWGRWLIALRSEYSPIENVDGIEELTVEHIGQEKDTFTPSGEEKNTTTPSGKTKTTNTIATSPEDNNVFYNQGKTVNESEFENYKNESVTSFTNRKNENVKEYINRKDITTNIRHGNIGITKSSELVSDEIALRKFNFLEMIVQNFLNQYFSITINGGCDDWQL